MNITLVFRNIDSSAALKDYVSKKIQKLEKLIVAPANIDVILSVNKTSHHAEIKCQTKRRKLTATSATGDLYESIEMAVGKLQTQLKKERDITKGHKTAHLAVRPQSQKLAQDVRAQTPHKEKRTLRTSDPTDQQNPENTEK